MLEFVSVFFFQAEDGIRDLVRSRGLGDVYKRQVRVPLFGELHRFQQLVAVERPFVERGKQVDRFPPVSYTHLTLPTSDLV